MHERKNPSSVLRQADSIGMHNRSHGIWQRNGVLLTEVTPFTVDTMFRVKSSWSTGRKAKHGFRTKIHSFDQATKIVLVAWMDAANGNRSDGGVADHRGPLNPVEDTLCSIRFQWSEMMHGSPNLHVPNTIFQLTKGCVATESRNVYDKLEPEVLVVKGAEKRTSIEMLAQSESQICPEVQTRRVHSEAQLAKHAGRAGGSTNGWRKKKLSLQPVEKR